MRRPEDRAANLTLRAVSAPAGWPFGVLTSRTDRYARRCRAGSRRWRPSRAGDRTPRTRACSPPSPARRCGAGLRSACPSRSRVILVRRRVGHVAQTRPASVGVRPSPVALAGIARGVRRALREVAGVRPLVPPGIFVVLSPAGGHRMPCSRMNRAPSFAIRPSTGEHSPQAMCGFGVRQHPARTCRPRLARLGRSSSHRGHRRVRRAVMIWRPSGVRRPSVRRVRCRRASA